ncbi:TPA: hypothetical protein ACGU7J_001676 [Vibrio vulnificus]
MATKDISQIDVLVATRLLNKEESAVNIVEALHRQTWQPKKCCIRAIEREERKGNLDYFRSIYFPFCTDKGISLVAEFLNDTHSNPSVWMSLIFGILCKTSIDGQILFEDDENYES